MTIASTLAINTLFSNNVTICVSSIVTDIVNQTFSSTQSTLFNGTLVLAPTLTSCGVSFPVLPLTSSDATIKFAAITDGTGGQALDLQTHANFASYGSVLNYSAPIGAPAFDPTFGTPLGYHAPTPIPTPNASVLTSPSFTSISPNGCVVVNTQGVYMATFVSEIDLNSNTLTTPFFNLRFVLKNSLGVEIGSGIVWTLMVADGTIAGATTFWSNIKTYLSGPSFNAANIVAVQANFVIFLYVGSELCYFLDNANATPVKLVAAFSTVARFA